MKKILYLFALCATIVSCKKSVDEPVVSSAPTSVTLKQDAGWLNDDYVASCSVIVDHAASVNLNGGAWESTLTAEQFNLIYSLYSGQRTVDEFYRISQGELLSERTLEVGTNTMLRKGSTKKIKSTPAITEYIVSIIGTPCESNAALNYYSLGASSSMITWQDAANSAFAELLPDITDFNPELIDWDAATYYSGCTYEVDYPYPLTILNGSSFIVIPDIGITFIHATCQNEVMEDAEPLIPLFDYYVQIPALGSFQQLYFIT